MTAENPSRPPLMLGLTGSIGMGKSTVAQMFEEAGVPVFDADAEVRAMQGPGGELVERIEAAFPGSTGPEGVIREALGAQVFGDTEKLKRLEGIVHPAVGKKRAQFHSDNAKAEMVLFDIPLLFERGGENAFDAVIVVSAPDGMQRERVLARPGMTAAKFEDILKLQVPDAEKRKRATHVIDTGTDIEETRAQVAGLIEELRAKRSAGRG